MEYKFTVPFDEVSKNIREWRKYCGLSLKECADYIGIVSSTYCYKEKAPFRFTFEEQIKLVNCINDRCREMGVQNLVTWDRVFNHGCALRRRGQ